MNPDIVVGSSFGGGILLRLVTEGLWTGPSLIWRKQAYTTTSAKLFLRMSLVY